MRALGTGLRTIFTSTNPQPGVGGDCSNWQVPTAGVLSRRTARKSHSYTPQTMVIGSHDSGSSIFPVVCLIVWRFPRRAGTLSPGGYRVGRRLVIFTLGAATEAYYPP